MNSLQPYFQVDFHEEFGKLHLSAGQPIEPVAALNIPKRYREQRLAGRCRLAVIDLAEISQLAEGNQALATATLVGKMPAPTRKFTNGPASQKRVWRKPDLQAASIS